jgi:hypothetical protein
MIDLSRFAEELKLVLQSILRSKGLIDSGALFNSIQVSITQDFQVNVISEDYLVFLEEDKGVIDEFVNSPQTLNILERAYEEYITEKIKLN